MTSSPDPAACDCRYPPPCPRHQVEAWVPGTPLPRPHVGPSGVPFFRIENGHESFDIKGYGLALFAEVQSDRLDPRRVVRHLRDIAVFHKAAGGEKRDRKRDAWEAFQTGQSLHNIPPETREAWEFLETQLDEYSLYRRSLLAPAEFKRPAPAWLDAPLTRPMRSDLPLGTFTNKALAKRYLPRLLERQAEWDAAHPDLPRYDDEEDYDRDNDPYPPGDNDPFPRLAPNPRDDQPVDFEPNPEDLDPTGFPDADPFVALRGFPDIAPPTHKRGDWQ